MPPLDGLPPIAVLAGGLATRMRPLTETVPKSMLEVAGEPFVAHQLRLFRRQGLSRVVLCLGHLSPAVEDFVGDGSSFGMSVTTSFDGEAPLGTAGALKKAAGLLGDVFWVVYGDSYLNIDLKPIWDSFQADGRPALMTVYRNENQWDKSNVHSCAVCYETRAECALYTRCAGEIVRVVRHGTARARCCA